MLEKVLNAGLSRKAVKRSLKHQNKQHWSMVMSKKRGKLNQMVFYRLKYPG